MEGNGRAKPARAGRFAFGIGLVGAIGLLAAGAYAMLFSPPGSIRVAPVSLIVHSSSTLPAEARALEAQTATYLFDRDTATAHIAYADQSLDVQLERTTEIQSIKVYGPAPYELAVQAKQGGVWNTIAGLDKIKLASQPSSWNAFQPTKAVTTGALRFLLTLPPGSGGGSGSGGKGNTATATTGGLPEIEIWASGDHALINGAALVAAMSGGKKSGSTGKSKSPAQARAYTASPADTVVGKAGKTFTFTLDRPARSFKRAWLAYETYGLAHWVSPARRINGLALQGGAFTFSGTDWTQLAEPIHPDWLASGSNLVEFALPANVTGSYSVRNVRIVAELDDGNNFIARATTGASATAKQTTVETDAPALTDGDLTTGWSPYTDPRGKAGQPELTLYFDKPTQLDTLSLNLVNALGGTFGVDLLVGGQWQNAGIAAVNGNKLGAGWNTLSGFAQVAAEALRITFQNGSGSPGEIREVAATGSGSGTAYAPAISVGYADAGQFYGRKAYIRGFLSAPDNGSGPAEVAIAGLSVPATDGSFGVVVSKEDAGYGSQADAEPWQVEVAALYPDGQKLSQIVKLTQGFDASKAHGLLPNMVNPGFEEVLVGGDASLEIGPGALDKPTKIKITPLAEKDLPRLDPGMTNVTRGPHRGYRFTPTPFKFKKHVKVTLPYDLAKVPSGLTEKDIKTYYFDTQAGHWVPLDRVQVDSDKKRVTSLTDHFTDMINATLTVPDHPEAISFNATQIKDIKAADPGAGINLIEAPQANNTGDARLSYPIEIPQGRQGMQPQLAISYNSGGGNSWLGLGWDLSIPSITVETRWGVPRYDNGKIDPDHPKETETYLLNGEMLTPEVNADGTPGTIAHRGALQNRTPEQIFHTRVEGQFRKIIRHGDKPTNYWWEVIDKNGARNYYGGVDSTDVGGKLGGNNGIFKWMLRETIDTHGNTVKYSYTKVNGSGTACTSTIGVAGCQIYIDEIDYTGQGGGSGPYTVGFVRTSELNQPPRADVTIDARGGFKQVTADRLGKIEVRHNGNLVRSYLLNYNSNAYGDGSVGTAFSKTLLTSLVQYGDDGITEFHRHQFQYFDEIRQAGGYKGFSQGNTWTTGGDQLSKKFLGMDVGPSALGGSEGASAGGSLSAGVSLLPTKYTSLNAMSGHNSGTSTGTLALVDIDGDSLPDKVFQKNGVVSYRRNNARPGQDGGNVTFGAPTAVTGISNISSAESSSFNFGAQGFVFGVNVIGDLGYTFNTEGTYFSDVNGDGLVDLVDNGTVNFNRMVTGTNNTKVPAFQATSAGSPYPIGAGMLNNNGLLPVDQFKDIEESILAQNPLVDSIRRWTAPYDGKITISGTVQLVEVTTEARSKYETADGVRVAIEKQGDTTPRWTRTLGKKPDGELDYTAYDPQTDNGNVTDISVKRGDVIYFRVASLFDGAYDEVKWAPVITYTDKPADVIDVNGLSAYSFAAAQDFVYAGRVSPLNLPFRGNVRLSGIIGKTAPTTDDVSLAVYHVTASEYETVFAERRDYSMLHLKKAPLYRRTLDRNTTGEMDLAVIPEISVAAGDNLVVIVEADSNIDLSKVGWKTGAEGQASTKAQAYYTAAYAPDQAPSATEGGPPVTDGSGNPSGFEAGTQLAVTDDKGEYLIKVPLSAEFNFYPDNTLTDKAQQNWSAPEMGWAVVTPSIQLKEIISYFTGPVPLFLYDTEVILTAKRRGELLTKRVMRLNKGTAFNPAEHSFAIPVPKGEQIYFDLTTRDPNLKDLLSSTSVKSHYVRPVVTALVDAIPLNKTGQFKSWTGPVGTVSVFPRLGAKAGAQASSGNIVLQVTQEVTSVLGATTNRVLVNRTIPFDTQAPFRPQDHVFDIALVSEGTLNFSYSTDNTTLSSLLETTAVNLSVTQQYAHQDQEFNQVPLTLATDAAPSATTTTIPEATGQLPVASTGFAAVAPTITVDGSTVVNIDARLNLVVTRQYAGVDNQGDPVIYAKELANYPIILKAGERYNPGANTFDVPVVAGDTLEFKFVTSDASLPGQLLTLGTWAQLRQSQEATVPLTALPSMLHSYGQWGFFANAYRGWSYGGYNGEGSFADAMIDVTRFNLSGNKSDYDVGGSAEEVSQTSMSQSTAYIAAAQPDNLRWITGDEDWWVTGGSQSSSRMGVNYVKLPRPEDLAAGGAGTAGSGASAVPRMSLVEGQQTAGAGFIISISTSVVPGKSVLDFMDLNGDRFPDVIGTGNIQYTEMLGGLGGTTGSTGDSFVRVTSADAYSIAPGGTVNKAIADAKAFFNPSAGQSTASPSNEGGFGLTGSMGNTSSSVGDDLVDINGDGLPDRVSEVGGTISVRLNLGYDFATEAELWGSAHLNDGYLKYINGGASYNEGVKGYSGGIALTQSQGRVDSRLIDINGDGLPDRVDNNSGQLSVGFNLGNSFADSVPWTGESQVNAGTNQSFSRNGGGSANITPGPLCLVLCYADINAGVSLSDNTGRAESALQDVNGDGYVDFVASTQEDKMDVALNRTRRTNLLKSVSRPLGATINLEYTRDGNTYEMPQSRWVMSKVEVNDGFAGDGVDVQVTTYSYSNGIYNRYERDFYGYQTVTEEQRNSTNHVYRKIVRSYHNGNYYAKGLQTEEQTFDGASGNIYLETVNTYRLRDIFSTETDGVLPETLDGDGVAFAGKTYFPMLTKTERRFYEGGQGNKSTYTEQEYDEKGNITRFVDVGDTGENDDVEATIQYSIADPDCQSSYIIGKAAVIEVKAMSTGNIMRRRSGTINCENGNITKLSQDIGNGTAAVTDLTYYGNGNLMTVTGPGDKERYALTYVYDGAVDTYVTSVTDSFGYASGAAYDYAFGKPLTTTDLNGNVISYLYDGFGRTKSVKGPYEQGTGKLTLQFAYHPEGSPGSPVPYATTDHLNLDASGAVQDPIKTILFTDGLKRVLQTKKSVSIDGQPMLTVSGRVEFDAMGRTIKQYYPVAETLVADGGNFNATHDGVDPTVTDYDILDRTVKTTLPDGTGTSIAYGFGQDRNGANQFRTTVTATDADGNAFRKPKATYRDIRQLITSVKETNGKVDIWTSYRYDPMKQIVEVRDAKGNLTTAEYDNLGRRTVLSNPDTGTTRTVYDPASNIVQKITANLAAVGQAVTYNYSYNRLEAIHYQGNPGNDVTYEYGAAGQLGNGLNQVGRLVKVTDASGSEERQYGKLGETVKETRTIASHTQGNSANSPEVYATQYHYDTFGRILRLTLPDSEIITYGYDAGGNLATFAGDKAAQGAGANHTAYLQTLHYDKFEQRTYLKLGNGIETNYTYRPDNRRLKNLTSEGKTAGKFQNLGYTYDIVGNITDLKNQVAIPAPNTFGGPTTQHFDYDDLYRLTHAHGNFKFSPGKVRDYTLDLGYSDIHNITGKTQTDTLTSAGGNPIPQKATSYDWAYAYGGDQPHAPTHIGSRTYSYDLNGNQLGWEDDKSGARRIIRWDEDNRISEIIDNGERSNYTYDDKGQRVIKETKQGETVYVNQYYVVRNRSIVSKHLFAGSSRLVTRLEMGTAPGNSYQGSGSNPTSFATDGSGQTSHGNSGQQHGNQGNAYGHDQDNPGQGNAQGQGNNASAGNGGADAANGKGQGKGNSGGNGNNNSLARNAGEGGGEGVNLPGNSEKGLENALANGKGNKYGIYKHLAKEGYSVDEGGNIVVDAGDGAAPITGDVPPAQVNGQSEFTYYYHPDHLGSTGFVTDANGRLYEHIEYFPFGETWVQEHSNTLRTPYLFTGKELDQETGLYYYGARYYDPRTSVWQSADPVLDRYLGGHLSGGVHNAKNLSLYAYAHQSPIKLRDPNGMWVDSGDGSFVAEKGDTLSGLQQETGRNWQTSDFKGDPKKMQIGQTVSFSAKNNSSSSVTVDSTEEAKNHYYNGRGESANLGPNTVQTLQQSPDHQRREQRIRNGSTQSLNGNYGVDLTSQVFHVGKTAVDYSTTCGTAACVTDFSGFVRDGFWDAKDVFNMFTGDGMGPNLEFEGGHPYQYEPYNWTISYPTPYKK